VAESPVQLHDDTERLIVIVGSPAKASGDDDRLTARLGQPMRSLDTSDVAELEHALNPVCHIAERIDQQLTPAVTQAPVKDRCQPRCGRPATLARCTQPGNRSVGVATLGKVKDEAKTVLKALYLGTCLINGLKSLDADSGFHPGGVKCGAVGGAVFEADGVTISAAAAAGAQTYADKVFGQFEPDVMRVDTGLAKSNYFALCGDATTAPLLCGGRFLNDDVIDVTYSYLLSGADPRAPLDGSASSDPLVNQLKALVSDGVQYSSNPAQNNDNATAPDPTNPNQFHPNISQGFPYSAAPF